MTFDIDHAWAHLGDDDQRLFVDGTQEPLKLSTAIRMQKLGFGTLIQVKIGDGATTYQLHEPVRKFLERKGVENGWLEPEPGDDSD